MFATFATQCGSGRLLVETRSRRKELLLRSVELRQVHLAVAVKPQLNAEALIRLERRIARTLHRMFSRAFQRCHRSRVTTPIVLLGLALGSTVGDSGQLGSYLHVAPCKG
jgi:hypothetical protein